MNRPVGFARRVPVGNAAVRPENADESTGRRQDACDNPGTPARCARSIPARAFQETSMNRLYLVLLGAVSLSACAQSNPTATATATIARPGAVAPAAGTPEARALAAVKTLNPTVHVDQIGPAAMPGFQEAIIGGQPFYISNDGRYLMQGALYDIATKTNLAEASMSKMRARLLKTIPVSDRIIFAPPNPKYTVTVFTDVECGYCRKLHSQIADYNQQGISVQYVAFPRAGLGSDDFRKMVAVWCSSDPRKALTDAKNDRPVAYRNCKNPVTMEYNLGQRMGLTGTPMVLTSDGVQVGGYLPPDALRAQLDKLAAGDKATPSTATGAP
jgi:thiol:disulfide interchange protein DsbC